ncbi:MAG: aminodeoxychorismate synthase component I [Candidatus Omnitrophica bacterium]|nr:aminodeoxychorismate synthase component I [Candidatus Omnitrophota bacterium]
MSASGLFETDVKEILEPHLSSPFVFLDTVLSDKENNSSFLFRDFVDILTFSYNDNPDTFFKKAEDYLNRGYWLSGYFNYEFGYFLEPGLYPLRQKNNVPLVWLGVCRQPAVITCSGKHLFPGHRALTPWVPSKPRYRVKNVKPNINQAEYLTKIKKIKYYLEQGLSYQVNFTFKIKFDFTGDILDFYLNLRRSQPTSYSALINTGQAQILSLSPELFFKIAGEKIITRPMKGTIPRALTLDGDRYARKSIKRNEKIRAENLMIVDLLRNDLGRVSKSVWVPKLFAVEKYQTLLQMTSTIEAKLKNNLKLKNIFSSLFPCGSVTGAPKIKTMEIIKELEKGSRGVYTGAIGYISPYKKAGFNVAIRTIYLKDMKGELGIGGGVLYDSDEKDEYKEALLKAKFFMQGFWKIYLIETILWTDSSGCFLLDLHLTRLKKSAKYFAIPLDMKKVRQKLKSLNIREKGEFKIRLLLSMEGDICIEKTPLSKIPPLVKIRLSSRRIDPVNCYLYHKTTRRGLYDKERIKAEKEGFFEVIFFNTHNQLTEGSITNIFIRKNNQLYTPPLKCGLLPGILREYLLKQARAKEKVLYLKDILEADKVYIGNSVRNLIEAKLETRFIPPFFQA